MLHKYFLEIRFPVQVEFFDGKSEKIKAFCPSEFPHWQLAHDPVDYKFFKGEKLNLSEEVYGFTAHNLVFSIESPPTDNYFQERFSKLFKKTLKWIEAPKILRLGVRHWSFHNISNMEVIVKRSLENGLFSREFSEKFGEMDTINDVAAVLQSENYKIQFGPMKKSPDLNYVIETVAKDKIADTFFYADVDTFSKAVELVSVPSEVKKLVSLNNSLSKKIFASVGGLT